MVQFLLLLHVLGAIGMGIYLVLPFLFARSAGMEAQARQGLVEGVYAAHRIGQFLLIAQFLTGGYLISQAKYSVMWMALAIVLFLAVSAVTGIAGSRMKRFIQSMKAGKDGAAQFASAKTLSSIAAIILLVTIIVMVYPTYR
ncbi:hypothetical protein [Ferviditalea candida]|uniref:DUF2269 family protein n=1 Tax=Ferviditalea candida TaxID=3108399 RepID=A0ABU5ZDF3_9BACL|nr:hypothetical protein [Paenibacillaceae bacterium T2]